MANVSSGSYPLGAGWRVLVRDLGLQPADVLRHAGLPDDLLSRPNARLAPEDFYLFWESLEASCTGEHFAIRFNEALKVETFFAPIFAALCSPNLLIAVRRVAQYKSLVAPMRVHVHEEDGDVVIGLEWQRAAREPPVSLVMSDLLFAVKLARVGTRERIVPVRVTTKTLPNALDPYVQILGVAPERDAQHRIVFSREDALRPFLTADNSLWEMFEPELQRCLAQLEGSATMRERTKAALLEGLPSGVTAMDEIARKLAMSKRTLQRRLDQEGHTFRAVLDATRQELAHHYLRTTTLSYSEIAFLLGFEETTSFYRAFQRWTGKTPETVRQARWG